MQQGVRMLHCSCTCSPVKHPDQHVLQLSDVAKQAMSELALDVLR